MKPIEFFDLSDDLQRRVVRLEVELSQLQDMTRRLAFAVDRLEFEARIYAFAALLTIIVVVERILDWFF